MSFPFLRFHHFVPRAMVPDGWGTLKTSSPLTTVNCRWSHDKVHIDDIMMRIYTNVKSYAGGGYSTF